MHQQARLPSRASTPAGALAQQTSRPLGSREVLGVGTARTRSGSTASKDDDPTMASSTKFPCQSGDNTPQNSNESASLHDNTGEVAAGNKKEQFQIDTEEIQDFREELQVWKTCGGFEHRPPPMIIEVYLDASNLKKGQCLVAMDDSGKRWDVAEALSAFDLSSDHPADAQRRRPELLLERWRIELKGSSMSDADDFGPILPTIYKKSIIFFRSLYTTALSLPGHKLAKQSIGKVVPPALEVKCRISTSETEYRGFDPIRHPLYDTRSEVATDFVFGDLEVPVGRFYASVTYRNNCHFRVDDCESLLSSQLDMTDYDFEPSLAPRESQGRTYMPEVGSLPYRAAREPEDIIQPIASAGTFHGYVPTGTSPMTTIRNYKAPGSESSSSPSESVSGREVPHSLPISAKASSSRPAGRSAHERRPSIFKAGSLSGSSPLARAMDHDAPASPHATTRPSGPSVLSHSRKPSSLTQGMPASLRGGPPLGTEPALSSSPKPAGASRFSSSFSNVNQHRRARPSFGATSRTADDDQGSSGKQSLSSSIAQPGSGLLADPGTSSGSLQQDQDDISEFLKALDNKKTLHSFDAPKKGESSAAGRKTAVQLSRFQMMRESNHALSESMSSSMHLHRSPISLSPQLTSVPGMAQASLSTASSPGKPLSPHTPHTPAIPSRLIENSIIDYNNTTAHARPHPADIAIPETSPNVTARAEGTTAIDIPLSPRLPIGGRSSSVAIRERNLADEDDPDAAFAAGRRSLSVGNDDGEPPTLSSLLNRNVPETSGSLQAVTHLSAGGGVDMMRQRSSSVEKDEKPPGGLITGMSASPRRRYMGLGRGQTPPPGSGSTSAHGSRYSSSLTRPGVGPDAPTDDEPLVFAMSELGQGRRSIEEGRGGASGGSSRTGERGGFNRTPRW
ncbi:autophagy protein atg13 [Zalerion maritima]|uniref:Autophagy-related protein 13 n=1 Tax=Zalerion maritima TaxID=339359 RepID=A0AAD5RYU5_9PEZI|nr:autophagy protein atg13 [Zalerion maritima]